MKKTFPLESPGHAPARVIESIKNEIRKYLKRERRKPLPEGVDFWDFDCRVGAEGLSPDVAVVHVKEIFEAIDRIAGGEAKGVHVEILAKAGHRLARPTGKPGDAEEDAAEDDFHG